MGLEGIAPLLDRLLDQLSGHALPRLDAFATSVTALERAATSIGNGTASRLAAAAAAAGVYEELCR